MIEKISACNGCAECISCGRKNVIENVLFCDNCGRQVDSLFELDDNIYICERCLEKEIEDPCDNDCDVDMFTSVTANDFV